MSEFLKWLTTIPYASTIFTVLLSLVVLTLAMVILIAFYQGREISFWPPKIGSKPYDKDSKQSEALKEASIEQFIVPLGKRKTEIPNKIKELLKKAIKIKMCGWSLFGTINDYRQEFRELLKKNCPIQILINNPESPAIKMINIITTNTDISERKNKGYPKIESPMNNVRLYAVHSKEFLEQNGFSKDNFRTCDSVLPIGIILVECEDRECWLGVQIYPLHYDMRINDRLTFIINDKKSELWRIVEEEFDHLWNDNYFREEACKKALVA